MEALHYIGAFDHIRAEQYIDLCLEDGEPVKSLEIRLKKPLFKGKNNWVKKKRESAVIHLYDEYENEVCQVDIEGERHSILYKPPKLSTYDISADESIDIGAKSVSLEELAGDHDFTHQVRQNVRASTSNISYLALLSFGKLSRSYLEQTGLSLAMMKYAAKFYAELPKDDDYVTIKNHVRNLGVRNGRHIQTATGQVLHNAVPLVEASFIYCTAPDLWMPAAPK